MKDKKIPKVEDLCRPAFSLKHKIIKCEKNAFNLTKILSEVITEECP
jgi:hypothetical protein